jgi:hypothetical protein
VTVSGPLRWVICTSQAERDRLGARDLVDGTVCVVTADRSLSLFRKGAGWLALLPVSPPAPPVDLIPADRLTLWQPGLNAVGGIPHYTTVFASLTPSGGDDTTQLNDAAEAASAAWALDGVGRVIALSAGTFDVAGSGNTGHGLELDLSGVVFRGAGPNLTFISRGAAGTSEHWPAAIIGKRWPKYSAPTDLATNGVEGAYVASLASNVIAGHALVAGDFIVINQEADPAVPVTWGIHDPGRGWFNEFDRPTGQILEVLSVVGTTPCVVTFNTPLRHSFSLTYGAHAVMFSDTPGGDANLPITRYSGFEDLCLEWGDGGDGGGNLHFFAAAYCWAKNIESRYSTGHSVNFDGVFRCELRDSFIHTTADPNPGGAGYGVGFNGYASDCLVENNIVWNFNKVALGRAGGFGCVWGYNYLDDGFGAGYRDQVELGLGASHFAGAKHVLFEGNRAFAYGAEAFWGNNTHLLSFRNHFTGIRANDPHLQDAPTSLPSPGLLDAHNRAAVRVNKSCKWHAFVGNVLGISGQSLYVGLDFEGNTVNQTAFVQYADPNDIVNETVVPMWQIGFDADSDPHDPVADAATLASTYRHGNYDYVTHAVEWDPTVSNHTLPSSLYLNAKPAFMGSKAWPWVTPEGGSPLADTLPAYDRFVAWSAA